MAYMDPMGNGFIPIAYSEAAATCNSADAHVSSLRTPRPTEGDHLLRGQQKSEV